MVRQWFRPQPRFLASAGSGVGAGLGVLALLALAGLVVGLQGGTSKPRPIDISGCRIDRIEFSVPPRAVLRRGFRVAATPIGVTLGAGHTCEAIATLSSTDPPHLVFVDRPTQKVDLALTRPAWEVAFNATSDTATRLRVRIDPVHCTRQGTCDTFYDEQVIAVFRSDRQIRAQTALDNFAEKITATVRQESAVRAGTPSTVMIDVAIPDSITDRDVDNLAITMQSLRYPPGPGDPPSTKELTGRAQVISFPYEVTSTHARDMEPLVGFQVRGRWQDVVLTHDLQLPVHVDVHSDNFVQRNLVAAVGVLVGLATITGVAIGARRGHGPPP